MLKDIIKKEILDRLAAQRWSRYPAFIPSDQRAPPGWLCFCWRSMGPLPCGQ